MDRYKFRGKRIDNGEWVYGYYFSMEHTDKRHSHHFIIPFGADLSKGTPIEKIQVEVDPKTVGQYVSANYGKIDLFEGDIVDCYGGELGIVYFDSIDGAFKVVPIGGDHLEEYYLPEVPINKVVGNIYDNPELLEVKG